LDIAHFGRGLLEISTIYRIVFVSGAVAVGGAVSGAYTREYETISSILSQDDIKEITTCTTYQPTDHIKLIEKKYGPSDKDKYIEVLPKPSTYLKHKEGETVYFEDTEQESGKKNIRITRSTVQYDYSEKGTGTGTGTGTGAKKLFDWEFDTAAYALRVFGGCEGITTRTQMELQNEDWTIAPTPGDPCYDVPIKNMELAPNVSHVSKCYRSGCIVGPNSTVHKLGIVLQCQGPLTPNGLKYASVLKRHTSQGHYLFYPKDPVTDKLTCRYCEQNKTIHKELPSLETAIMTALTVDAK
jgi:hypothetical protein